MKKLFLSLIIPVTSLLISANAHAVVADRFKCQFRIVENGTGESTQQDFDYYLGRLPLSASPAPDVRMTAASATGRLQMDNARSSVVANLTFSYEHGMKLDSTGHVIDARQSTCLAISANWCAKTQDPSGGIQACAESSVACNSGINPFDPAQGWSVVGHAPDGTPLFDENALTPLTANFTDNAGVVRGTASVSCQYEGSYQ